MIYTEISKQSQGNEICIRKLLNVFHTYL